MKKLVLMLTLLVAVAFAANFSSLSNSTSLSNSVTPPTEHNAHWQLGGGGSVECVRDGEAVYGSNDDADLTYSGTTIDLTGFDGAAIYVNYTQVAADANDYCTMELNGGVGDVQFADAAGATVITKLVPASISNLTINFNWVSDATGFAAGFKMTVFQVYGVNNGDGTYTNIFDWNSDQGFTHESHDVTGMASNGLACLSFHYTDGGWDWYWAIDNVVLDADGTDVISEDFEAAGWDQDQNGESGLWELDVDRAGGAMAGQNWQADSDGNGSFTFNCETFSPWVSIYQASAVTADFDSNFEDFAGRDHAIFGYYVTLGTGVFTDNFTDLSDWTTSDSGTNIEETTWGQIKTM
ncbi:hypothetical protein K8R78_06080 [bacterium]|nr:hypothetical protein [bacterium]